MNLKNVTLALSIQFFHLKYNVLEAGTLNKYQGEVSRKLDGKTLYRINIVLQIEHSLQFCIFWGKIKEQLYICSIYALLINIEVSVAVALENPTFKAPISIISPFSICCVEIGLFFFSEMAIWIFSFFFTLNSSSCIFLPFLRRDLEFSVTSSRII